MNENIEIPPQNNNPRTGDTVEKPKYIKNEDEVERIVNDTNLISIDFKKSISNYKNVESVSAKEKDQAILEAMTRHPSNFKIEQ